ncbi:DUF2934 domain-containing protein [Azospirillum rugosum]|nr:DUF2934 domain-containing protein [Azospirillum rugosum]
MERDRDRLIRERAYLIWEREGRPEGRADAHWFQALRELQAEGQLSRRPVMGGHAGGFAPVKARSSMPSWGRRHWCHLAQRAA